jgi:hypothetical protein
MNATRFDDWADKIRTLAFEMREAEENGDLTPDESMLFATICLAMGYADNVPPEERPFVRGMIGAALLPVMKVFVKRYDSESTKES